MKITFSDSAPSESHCLVMPIFEADLPRTLLAYGLPEGRLRTIDGQPFTGALGQISRDLGSQGDRRDYTILVGLGGDSKPALMSVEVAGGRLMAHLLEIGEALVAVDASRLDGETSAHFTFGAVLRAWRYDSHRTRKIAGPPSSFVVFGGSAQAPIAWASLQPLASAILFARDLQTAPPNVLYPETFVDRVRALSNPDVDIRVMDQDAMREAGMGALLGVAQGSIRPARLLVMHWNGSGHDGPPVAFVGKGVTFDSGGISLKVAAGMEEMKWDMSGAAAVTGAVIALAGRRSPANVVAVCPLVENMPSGSAQRPGDIVTTMSGQTVEVINTDAEGRLILADAITWVQRNYGATTVIDFATLTGAAFIALGHERGALFSNDEALATELSSVGELTGERLWRMPLDDAYGDLIESSIADMKNIGPREGGAIVAAHFIKRFVDPDTRWAHVDFTGTAWAPKSGPLCRAGAVGFGVRLLDAFARSHLEAGDLPS